MSQSDVIGGSAVPLADALPWVSSCVQGVPRTYLVHDAIDTDGRFLLYTLASEVLSSNANSINNAASAKQQQQQQSIPVQQGRVLWLGCTPTTDEQLVQGLKKIGCDRNALPTNVSLRSGNKNKEQPSLLTIRNLCMDISNQMAKEEEIDAFSESKFLKNILLEVDEWLNERPSSSSNENENTEYNNWIILDDASTFAGFVGERLMCHFILQLNAKSHNQRNPFGLMIRCSNDQEDESLPVYSGASMKGYQDWFGAGGRSSGGMQQSSNSDSEPPWERSLIELADGVMDVLPLTSGYTRELHGRIVLTQMPFGRGWGNGNPSDGTSSSTITTRNNTPGFSKQQHYSAMQIINYCITDQNPKIVAYIM